MFGDGTAFQFPSKFARKIFKNYASDRTRDLPRPREAHASLSSLGFAMFSGVATHTAVMPAPPPTGPRKARPDPCLAQLRASSIATFDDGARCGRRQCVSRMERREAQDPSHGSVRLRTTHRLADRSRPRERIATLPPPPGAPFPSFEGKRKTGTKPGARNPNHGTAQRTIVSHQYPN